MIDRPMYREAIAPYVDAPLVKVLSGVRRSGKSTILLMVMETLKDQGVPDSRIVRYSFDSLRYVDLHTEADYYRMLSDRLSKEEGRVYLFLDEVQEVPSWEKVVNSLMVEFDVDLYVTGSNSRLLASEISTYLTGRYVSIPVYPLSFREFLAFANERGIDHHPHEMFTAYLRQGGFPVVNAYDMTEDQAYAVVGDIYASIVLKDIVQRHDIRKTEQLERIARFALENAGKTFSAKTVSDYLKSQQRAISTETVYGYLSFLEQAFLLYRCPRFDIRAKEVLKTQEKYFVADSALKYSQIGYSPTSVASMLENAVYLELRRRGYAPYVGKLGSTEIDFVAEKQGDRMYVQVARSLELEATRAREYGNLLAIRDGYPKFVVTADASWEGYYEGVRTMHVVDFLLSDEW